MKITTSPTAKILEVSENTVRNMGKRGVLRMERTVTVMRLFDADDVARVAEERQAKRAVVVGVKRR